MGLLKKLFRGRKVNLMRCNSAAGSHSRSVPLNASAAEKHLSRMVSVLKSIPVEFQRDAATLVHITDLADAQREGLDAAMWLSRIQPEKAFEGLESAWHAALECPYNTTFIELERDLAMRVLAIQDIDVAVWLLANSPERTDLSHLHTSSERAELVRMLESRNAVEALVHVCRRSKLASAEAAQALERLRGDEALTLLENAMTDASASDLERERLQSCVSRFRADAKAREEGIERLQRESSMRAFIQKVVEKSKPESEEIETCFRYLQENPELISGFSRMTTMENLRKKKEEIEQE